MPTYLAFLRAINLGARRRFPKDAVTAATEAAGGTDVATYLNTGNVRLTSARRSRERVEADLEAAYLADRGFEVPTIVLTPAELRRVADDADELAAALDEGGRQFVSLLKAEPDAAGTRVIESAAGPGERAVVRGRAVHLLLDGDYRGATLTNATVEKALGVATNRNVTVIRALASSWAGR